MRRRTLLSGGSVDYVFSAHTTSVSVTYNGGNTTVNIKSTANGSNIGYSVVSYDGTVVTSVGPAATYVTFYCTSNSTDYSRSGNVVLKQNDSNKTITITVSQSAQPLDLGYGGILLDGTSGSYGSFSFGKNVLIRNVPSWADVTYSSGKINVTATTTNSDSGVRTADILVSYGSQSGGFKIIQLPSDYHSRDYVDINGTNWAIKNVGASSVQDYGNYYQWGAGSATYQNTNQYHTGGTNSSYTLPSSADTATQVMGSSWKMPTRSELSYLASYTSYYWVSYNGVNGGVFTNGREVLFFPASGYYYNGGFNGNIGNVWSSNSYDSSFAYYLVFHRGNDYMASTYRNFGLPVRGVNDAA